MLQQLGKEGYLKMPKPNTNPSGVEYSRNALNIMTNHKDSLKIQIDWDHDQTDYDTYKRWVEYWADGDLD